MSADLREILHSAAAVPLRPLDLDRLRARARRRRWTPAAAALVVLAGLVTATLVTLPRATPQPGFGGFPPGWTELPPIPEGRVDGVTAWTGERLLAWSGRTGDREAVAGGYEWDARRRYWDTMPASPLAPRVHAASAWTGRELLVWGGERVDGVPFGDGAAYDPWRRTWRPLPPAPIGARAPLSAWTGEELIVWGSASRPPGIVPTDGAAYRPATDTWRPITDAPVPLTDATAVWTGREVIVLGAAVNPNTNQASTEVAVGARYDPTTDSWRRLPDSQLSPQASTAAWDGRQLVGWDYRHKVAGYRPDTDAWQALPDVPLRTLECVPRAVSVGPVLFGEFCGLMAQFDPASGRWRDVSHAGLTDAGWLTLVPAGPAVLLVGTGPRARVLAYQPG